MSKEIIQDEELELLEKELDRLKAFLILKNSEGGKYLLEKFKQDREDIVQDLIGCYQEASHIQLINKLSNLSSISTMIDSILESEEKVEILKHEYESIKKPERKDEQSE